jgi:hypothetical protein
MKRKALVASVVLAVNVPWAVLWWHFTRPGETSPGSIAVLLLLLVVAGFTLIFLPAVLIGNLFPRRWLLILSLAFVNLFWALRWVDTFNRALPDDAAYRAARYHFLLMHVISSVAVLLLYRLTGLLLSRSHNRRDRQNPPFTPRVRKR